MRMRGTKLWSMWDDVSWGARPPGKPGCWSGRGGSQFFADAFAGGHCDRNWLEGWVDEGPTFTADAPALMGKDPAILEFCLRKLGRWRKIWFAKDAELARACMDANQNVLRVHSRERPWDICSNFEFVACAARGNLPRQGLARIEFATAPGSLPIDDLQNDKTDQYRMEDVLYLEVCILNELCANNQRLFALQAGEGFLCESSRKKFDAFRDLMMGLDA